MVHSSNDYSAPGSSARTQTSFAVPDMTLPHTDLCKLHAFKLISWTQDTITQTDNFAVSKYVCESLFLFWLKVSMEYG